MAMDSCSKYFKNIVIYLQIFLPIELIGKTKYKQKILFISEKKSAIFAIGAFF